MQLVRGDSVARDVRRRTTYGGTTETEGSWTPEPVSHSKLVWDKDNCSNYLEMLDLLVARTEPEGTPKPGDSIGGDRSTIETRTTGTDRRSSRPAPEQMFLRMLERSWTTERRQEVFDLLAVKQTQLEHGGTTERSWTPESEAELLEMF